MEGYRSEEQSASQKRTVKRICDKSNRFHKRVIKNPARLCDQKDHKSFNEAGRWRPFALPHQSCRSLSHSLIKFEALHFSVHFVEIDRAFNMGRLHREPESRQNGSTRGFDLISDVFSFGRLCYVLTSRTRWSYSAACHRGSMSRKSFVPHTLLSLCLLISTDTSQVMAANMRSFIEGVRRKATFVYVGSVKEVQLLARTKFDIKARAVVNVLAIVRGPGMNPREATIEYSSFDDKTPMLEGGPQYQLRPGVKVVIFANSFASSIPPGYLLQGSREELLQRVVALRDSLSRMSPDQLKVHEIDEEDRRVQLELYDKLCAYLRASK
jgi:hypothetical protein